MDLRSRLNRLEGAALPMRTARTLVLFYDDPDPEDVRPDDVIIRVSDEEARQLVLRVINGEIVNTATSEGAYVIASASHSRW